MKRITIQLSDIDGYTVYQACIDALRRERNITLLKEEIAQEYPFSARISVLYPSIFGSRVNIEISINGKNKKAILSMAGSGDIISGDIIERYGRYKPDIFYFHTVRSINRIYRNMSEILKEKYDYSLKYKPFSITSYIYFYLFIAIISILCVSFVISRFFIRNDEIMELCIYLLIFIAISVIYYMEKHYELKRRLRFFIPGVGFLLLIFIRYFIPDTVYIHTIGIQCRELTLTLFLLLISYLIIRAIAIFHMGKRLREHEIRDMKRMEIERVSSVFVIFSRIFGFISFLLGLILGIVKGFSPISMLIILIGIFLIIVSLSNCQSLRL